VLAVGARTKPRLSQVSDEVTLLSTRGLRGIVEYEPDEFTFTALAGTSVREIGQALAEKGQYLPFDPMWLEAGATLGEITRVIRAAVNNLAGIPSIVYGIFGLGFFVYGIGGLIDQWFFPERLAAGQADQEGVGFVEDVAAVEHDGNLVGHKAKDPKGWNPMGLVHPRIIWHNRSDQAMAVPAERQSAILINGV